MPRHAFIDARAWNRRVLEHRWQRAHPFCHVVMRNAVDEVGCQQLSAALDEVPAERIASEIHEVNATGHLSESSEQAATPAQLVALCAELGSAPMLDAVGEISGKTVTRVLTRGYAFSAGHYLLPHANRDVDTLRQVAFALYVTVTDDLEGGELELFDCRTEHGKIIATEPAGRISPRAGTLVLLDVSDSSLHQVREVTRGTRGSISGWFY